ncbi:AMP-binding protein [Paenibacillus sp. LMG 31461]|uniref:AMP-binding protein n=1 Tax=Paenibacillus plantarum TaxID=2654975 RepID=A0ABX1X4B9_9BACL|nr:AMP-binding protein [Paenibacillus plantarum]NOU63251.1 AMP-binding protein [Paenibacillus plantarum]
MDNIKKQPLVNSSKGGLNKSYRLEQLHIALKNNTVNYLEFYGRNNTYLRKTYAEVYLDVHRTISLLKSMKLQPRDRVGILGANSYEYVIADLAVVMGGYVSVPFPDKYFLYQIGNLHEEYELKLLFVDSHNWHQINNEAKCALEKLMQIIDRQSSDENNIHIPDGEDIFMINFTSGTTGFPKGIEIRSKCLEEWVSVIAERFPFTSEDKLINFLPLHISNARFLIYAAILLPFNLTVTLSDQLMKVLQESRPTILQGVPYLFETVYGNVMRTIESSPLRHVAFRAFRMSKRWLPPKMLSKLQSRMFRQALQFWGGRMRLLVTGSAPISTKVLDLFEDMGLNIYESYGINEIGLVSINSPGRYRFGTVGQPFSTKQVVIGDNQEILVRSDYSWGTSYLNKSEVINAEIFKSDGFISTGDMGYLDDDGYLHVIGRIKELLVLATGEKVHPNLIEEMLRVSTSIKQVVAIGDGKHFISCILVLAERSLKETEIHGIISHANKRLPEALRIRGYVLAKEPFTIENGLLNSTLKINRNKVFEAYRRDIDELYEEG